MLNSSLKRLFALSVSLVMLLYAIPVYAAETDDYNPNEPEDMILDILGEDIDGGGLSGLSPEYYWGRKKFLSMENYEDIVNANDEDKFLIRIQFSVPDEIEEKIRTKADRRAGFSSLDALTCSEKEYNDELTRWTEEDEESVKSVLLHDVVKRSIIYGRVCERKGKRYQEALTEVKKEIFPKFNEEKFNSLGLDAGEDDIVLKSETEPYYHVMLTQDDIMKAAESDSVQFMVYLGKYEKAESVVETYDPNPKFSDRLNEEIQKNSAADVPVCIEFTSEYVSPETFDIPKIPDDKFISSKLRDFGKKVSDLLIQADLSQYKPMISYRNETRVYITLPVSELYRITDLFGDRINCVYYWDKEGTNICIDDVFTFDSGDSLTILRASVGLEDKNWSIAFDVNQDGDVDSVDALIALRASVHLENVSNPTSTIYPIYDVSKYGKANCESMGALI